MTEPTLAVLTVGDPSDAWASAGFRIDDDGSCRVGQVRVRFGAHEPGLAGWALRGVDRQEIDGIPTEPTDESPAEAVEHPNGVLSIDHVVVVTPDMDRTVAALESVGLRARRTRRDERLEKPRLQTFFRMGEPILEVIGPVEPRGDGPARLFGLAHTVGDLDATAALLGDGLGRISDAVQEGRRIATLRHEALGLSVATAFMSPEP